MWNKNALEEQINTAIDQGDQRAFDELSKKYAKYL
ncbi:IDEAL domain-containing protein [Piscibacillus salipiscarius]|nr:IDEAL domain-containing protein [Piscibacillus salipiscarius]